MEARTQLNLPNGPLFALHRIHRHVHCALPLGALPFNSFLAAFSPPIPTESSCQCVFTSPDGLNMPFVFRPP